MLIILLMMFDGVGDKLCFTPDELLEDNLHDLRVRYRYSCIYNFFIFA